MKIFISHSWKNKTAAQLIAESLENSAEVWLDIQRMKPGDRIQPTIDEALAQMDAIVLLWSRDSANSDGVDAEIRTAVSLKKNILPVLLDGTPTDNHPLLQGLYGINFDVEDCKPGLFRVQAGLLRLSMGSLDIESASALNDLTTFEGFFAYVEEFRNRKEIGGADSTLWAVRSMEQCTRAYQSLSELRDQVGETLHFIQDTFERVQASSDYPVVIQSILDEVVRHPKSQTREFKVLISFLEGKLSSLSSEHRPPVALRSDADEVAHDFAHKLEKHVPSPSRSARDPAPTSAVDDQSNPALQLIHNYILSAPLSLQQFTRLATMLPSMSLKQVANELHAYLSNPNDLIPDDQNGLLGFADDAWLIHNTIYRCIEAGFFGPQDIGIQWDVIVQADPLVVQILPSPVRNILEQLLMQYLRVIGEELAQYQPQFMPQAQFNSYAAFMGDGSAVGGAPSGGPQSIDDVIYTIGDKMVYYGGG